MQIIMNMRQDGNFNTSTSEIDSKCPMTIIIRTASDYKTQELLEKAHKYIKDQGIRDNIVTASVNQILLDAGFKPVSPDKIKDLLLSTKGVNSTVLAPIIGEEPLKSVNLAMGK